MQLFDDAMKAASILLLFLPMAARATVIFSDFFPVNQPVPDDNPAGLLLSRTLVGTGIGSIESMTVTLEMSGGWNGDLYAYLAKQGAPGIAILLNRIGVVDAADPDDFGSPSAGFSVVFDDLGMGGDIHSGVFASGSAIVGVYEPDARAVSPFEVRASDDRYAFLSAFQGESGDGTWQLFVADLASGESSTLVSWGITMTATASSPSPIPEPAGIMTVGLVLATALTFRSRCKGKAS